ncbi:heme o synthase [Alphaproteobacteria bacterium]|nr:heme o synthase [Alphaproteobacteria bacterium]MDA8544776.1 heme o synthase [Alphaproteobacteria bacterium]MDA8624533.1 heme o synthase [Alphaproteobacteria bacterium]MDA8643248.1 heme o synthase [Alphaproteobacteria bacterium]MDA8666299.1 heme o synthase [Alphaproteobacteria bacterium]
MSQTHKEALLKMQEPASTDVGSAADYIALMKPRVMSLVVFTALVGLVMAPGAMHPVMAIAAILLIAVGAGASAALNMWYDADIDAVMSRTQDRPVPSGRVTADGALTFGLWVSGLSVLSMAVMINYLSAALLAFTIFFYAVIYTMYLKRRTAQNIVIGGAAGALPPVIGWAAATNSVSIEPLIYFAIIFFWTPPHFWALALIKNDDYQAANVPMLPVTAGVKSTLSQIVLYAFVLFGVTMLPYGLGFSGLFYASGAAVLGGIFVALCLVLAFTGEKHRNRVAGMTFAYSIFYLFLLFVLLPTDKVMGL